MKILVVDDNENIRIFLKRVLSSKGYDVHCASNGNEALLLAGQQNPALVISDILMPEMDGFELCRRIKSDEALSSVPFIFYTAKYTSDEDKKLALKLGADRFMVKPLNHNHLVAIIQNVLDEYERPDPSNKRPAPIDNLYYAKHLEIVTKKLNKTIKKLDNERRGLQQSEQQMRLLLNSTAEGIFGVDLEGNFTFANPACKRELGCSDDELTGKPVHALLYPEKPDGSECRLDDCLIYATLKEQKATHTDSLFLRRNSGDRFPVECWSHPVIQDDRMVGAVVTFLNITSRRVAEQAFLESESRYRHIMESMKDAVYICSKEHDTIEYMNSAMIQLIGYDASGGGSKAAIEEIIGECPWCRDENGTQEKPVKEKVIYAKNGRIYHASATPVSNEPGESSILITLRDITETRHAEEQLRQAQKMQAIGALAGGIAHDFNNILSPILGFSQILKEELPPGSDAHEDIIEIYKAGLRGRDLVKQILAFGRQSDAEKSVISIQTILKEVCKLVRSIIPSNISIVKEIENDCGGVLADPTQIHQVCMNLITNAYQAIGETNGEIRISLTEEIISHHHGQKDRMKPGKYAVMKICDTGSGMEPEKLEKIFEPYYTTKKKDKGTGLGLTIVYGIVNDYGGDIKVKSSPGEGTTFTLYFPVAETEFQADSSKKKDQPRTGDENILLVDDEPSVMTVLQLMLEKSGYRVTGITNSIQALKTFKKNPDRFDLVITDMAMPHMTGQRLTKEILAIRPDMPILACTGFSRALADDQARGMGLQGVLMKPVAKSELTGMIRKVLDKAK